MALCCVMGCRPETPEQAFDRIAEAAEAGDEPAFLDGLTPDSRAAMEMVLSNRSRHPKPVAFGSYAHRVRALEHRSAGPMVVVLVETDHEPPQLGQVVMRADGRSWLLDLLATEILWSRNWAMSGGPPRSFPGFMNAIDPTAEEPYVPLP